MITVDFEELRRAVDVKQDGVVIRTVSVSHRIDGRDLRDLLSWVYELGLNDATTLHPLIEEVVN